MKKLIAFCSVLILSTTIINAQSILKGGTKDSIVAQYIDEGGTELNPDLNFIKSIDLEQGDVLVLFERYSNGKISGRHKLITSSEPDFLIGFKCKYAIIFNNPNEGVIGFEDPNFSGNSMTFEIGKTAVPDDFGMSSIYIPEGKKVKLYMIDPALYPEQEIDHRPMGAGIRPFIGVDVNDKVKFIVVE